jgi:hypothetical protein
VDLQLSAPYRNLRHLHRAINIPFAHPWPAVEDLHKRCVATIDAFLQHLHQVVLHGAQPK